MEGPASPESQLNSAVGAQMALFRWGKEEGTLLYAEGHPGRGTETRRQPGIGKNKAKT